MLNIDSHLVTDSKLAAEILDDQYKSVFVVEPEEEDLLLFISKLTNGFYVLCQRIFDAVLQRISLKSIF